MRMGILAVSFLALTVLTGCAERPTSQIVEDVRPGVVLIANQGTRGSGLGSGFIIGDNQIVTNQHVVDGANELTVYSISSETKYKAKVIHEDKVVDIAVIQLEKWDDFAKKEGHTNLTLADSDRMKIGDKVIVIGHPSGLGWSVSEGILSAKDRRGGNNPRYMDQIDANLFQGNSGGPVFNDSGQVACVSNMMLEVTGGSYGFCIPSTLVEKALNDFEKFGEIRWRAINVGAGLTDDGSSVILKTIEPNGAAAAAGLKEGDKVLKVYTPNNHPEGVIVHNPNELITELAKMHGDDESIRLLIDRNGNEIMVSVKTNYRLSSEFKPDPARN